MTLVQTSYGTLRGMERGGVSIWRGIPYAAPPVGARRFRPPEPPERWTGERDATRFGAAAVQNRDPRTTMLSGLPEKLPSSEDCLMLNVTSPGTTGKRPVLVWIHGGAFVMGTGSTPLYDGTSFAREHGLVVVTINYRLGLLGFLDVGGPGNVALLDQVAALRWVRSEIAAFGGDPDAVTVMGESAGAVSVTALMAMPAAAGLFRRAIAQSGAPGLSPPTREDARAMALEVTAEVGDPWAVSTERLVAIQERLSRQRGLAAFAPYVDGDTLPRPAIEQVAAGSAAGVPLLVGWNRDEWGLFALFMGDSALDTLKPIVRMWLGPRADDVLALYRGDWVRVMGDLAFRIPVVRFADAQARHAPVYVYRFDFESSAFGGKLGAAHALELPFVWNALDLPVSRILLGDAAERGRELATRMHAAWATFVRGGSPGWDAYDPSRRPTMVFDVASRVVDDPDRETRTAWG